ncbi:acyltransferase family protein [Streptomyces sp. NPDC006510]|uniref:acyltransferase family protein n=1 Tax=Streptomyces sp. NPDC006510 TaxID=3155600 RepID=UPI0033BA3D81
MCAIGGVVLGHWLLVSITYRSGHLSGLDALQYVGWGRWLTLLLQVMTVFFVVGGYANAISWTAHQQRGEGWTNWLRGRMLQLLWPTTVYVVVGALAVTVARIAGVDMAALARAGWLATLHLWFLPVYLLLIALTPLLLAAHRRWGLAVPAVMAVAAAGVDAVVLGPHLPLIGFANYLLVWGTMHQWGFAWQDGTLTRPRWRCGMLSAVGAMLLTTLLVWGPFPVSMIGTGARVGNTTPPSIALLAFAATQTGLLLAVEPAVERLLAHPWRWRLVSRLNRTVVTVYLWHMTPVIIVAGTFYPTGVMPQPTIGSAQWWALRPAWITLLTALLVPLTVGVMRTQRPLRLLPAGLGAAGWWSPALVLCALGAIVLALVRLAIDGFAPGGHVPALVLATYVCGLLAALCSGRPPSGRTG